MAWHEGDVGRTRSATAVDRPVQLHEGWLEQRLVVVVESSMPGALQPRRGRGFRGAALGMSLLTPDLLLQHEPHNMQAQSLQQLIDNSVTRDGYIGALLSYHIQGAHTDSRSGDHGWCRRRCRYRRHIAAQAQAMMRWESIGNVSPGLRISYHL